MRVTGYPTQVSGQTLQNPVTREIKVGELEGLSMQRMLNLKTTINLVFMFPVLLCYVFT